MVIGLIQNCWERALHVCERRHIGNGEFLIETWMMPIETMSWTAQSHCRYSKLGRIQSILSEAYMFPRCANSDCSSSFSSLREGTFFRFRRTDSDPKADARHHLVEHAWLCTACSKQYTLEYCENKAILVSLAPAMPVMPFIEVTSTPVPLRKRARSIRRRRPSSRRASAQPPANNPLILLAINPRGDFDRS